MKKRYATRLLVCAALGLSVTASTTDAAKAKKKESEVTKALKETYPDAKTEITGTNEVNGVKVYDVKVTTKEGDSSAQITDYGDFLMYGVPHEYGAVQNLIANNVAGLFKSQPSDIDMYRVTNYSVDFAGKGGKNYSARFDAVGRLTDISSANEIKRTSGTAAHGAKASDADAKKAEAQVKKYQPDAVVEGVYKSEEGGDFLYVDTKNGEWILNPGGQVYSFREEVKAEELPEPITKTIQETFSSAPTHAYRGEYEYYQFNQQSQTGEPIVVKMRPNGDILEVNNDKAKADQAALEAKAKQAASKSPAATPAAKKKG